MTPKIHISTDAVQLAEDVAQFFVVQAKKSISARGRFTAALAGGSTPKAAYRLLADPGLSSQIDWSHVYIFWGDERCIPPTHKESNYCMAAEALLNQVPLPSENIHRMKGELEPQIAADQYEIELRSFFSSQPYIDLILLGMGTDGHTASLFPGTAAIHETEKWAAAHYVEKLAAWRLTLTPAIINRARKIAFIISGENKAEPLHQVLQGKYQPDVFPSQIIQPETGTLTWFIDKPASSLVTSNPNAANDTNGF